MDRRSVTPSTPGGSSHSSYHHHHHGGGGTTTNSQREFLGGSGDGRLLKKLTATPPLPSLKSSSNDLMSRVSKFLPEMELANAKLMTEEEKRESAVEILPYREDEYIRDEDDVDEEEEEEEDEYLDNSIIFAMRAQDKKDAQQVEMTIDVFNMTDREYEQEDVEKDLVGKAGKRVWGRIRGRVKESCRLIGEMVKSAWGQRRKCAEESPRLMGKEIWIRFGFGLRA